MCVPNCVLNTLYFECKIAFTLRSIGVWNDGHFTPSTNAILEMQQKLCHKLSKLQEEIIMTWQHILVLGTPVYRANVLQIHIYNQALTWYVFVYV